MTTSKKKFFFWRPQQWLWFILGYIVIFAVLMWWQVQSLWSSFASQAGVSSTDFLRLYRDSQAYPLKSEQDRINFLLLGVDLLPNRPDNYPLTDTIILVSLNIKTGQINLLPLPRDIYLPELNNKINALYAFYYQSEPEQALTLTTDFLSQFLALPLHYSVVVTLADVADFLTLIDGVEVNIVNSFTDHLYPRDEIDPSQESDSQVLYETISFEAGSTHLDASQVLKFMRSRHAEGPEGNDYARSARQQLVLQAVLQKMMHKLSQEAKVYDFTFLGQLYAFYHQHYQKQIPFIELLAMARLYLNQTLTLTFKTAELNIAPRDELANLVEMESNGRINKMWHLAITDKMQLQTEIKTKLDFNF